MDYKLSFKELCNRLYSKEANLNTPNIEITYFIKNPNKRKPANKYKQQQRMPKFYHICDMNNHSTKECRFNLKTKKLEQANLTDVNIVTTNEDNNIQTEPMETEIINDSYSRNEEEALLVYFSGSNTNFDCWYLDSCCSSHMTL